METEWSVSMDKPGRIFWGRLWLTRGSFTRDDMPILTYKSHIILLLRRLTCSPVEDTSHRLHIDSPIKSTLFISHVFPFYTIYNHLIEAHLFKPQYLWALYKLTYSRHILYRLCVCSFTSRNCPTQEHVIHIPFIDSPIRHTLVNDLT
jgi:hypothetical protein